MIYIKEVDNISQEDLIKKGFLVGYIRPPTVKKEIFRIVARINEDFNKLQELKRLIDEKI